MAYDDFFGDIDNTLQVSSLNLIRRQAVTGADPNILYAVGAIQISITIIDVWIECLFTQGGGTLGIETNIAAAGLVALTDVMACAVDTTITRATTMDPAQAAVGPADALNANKNAATNVGMVNLLFYLT